MKPLAGPRSLLHLSFQSLLFFDSYSLQTSICSVEGKTDVGFSFFGWQNLMVRRVVSEQLLASNSPISDMMSVHLRGYLGPILKKCIMTR